MKKILNILRRPFRVQYRLSVLYRGETTPRQHYGLNGRMLRNMAKSTEKISIYWTLYKRGPFGLSERVVDYNN
jgi:hypothetical protein